MNKIRSILKDPRSLAMTLSMLTAFVMLIGKLAAFYITRSSAIFSDAAESVVHLFAIAMATFCLWYSRQPPDEDHQYGHGKIAYFSAAIEAILILAASLVIIYMAIDALIHGIALNDLDIGLSILLVLTFINLILGSYLVWVGKKHNSFILIADGKHILTDMWTSFGVIVGVLVVWLTNITWLDPLIAIIVACNIIWTAISLLRQSYQGLMEKVEESTTNDLVSSLEKAVSEGKILSFHQLRHRRVNDALWIDVHLLFPSDSTLKQAHEKASSLEIDLIKSFPKDSVYVTTHLEPSDHQEAHPKGHPEYHLSGG